MGKINVSDMKIGGIAACITCLLYTSGFLTVFTPFPLLFISVVYGKRARCLGIFFSLIAFALLYLFALPLFEGLHSRWPAAKLVFLLPGAGLIEFFNLRSVQYFGLVYIFYFILFGYLLSEGIIRRWPLNRLFGVCVGATFVYLVLAVLAPELMGVDVFEGVERYMHSILNEITRVQEAAGLDSYRIQAIKRNTDKIVTFSIHIIPSAVFLLGVVVASVNQLLARWMIRVPDKFSHLGDTSRYSVHHNLVWVTIALGFLYFADRYLLRTPWLSPVLINGLIVCGGIYLIQGVLIISFYVRRMKTRYLRALVYLLIIMFIQVAAPLITILGFTDLWVDYRRIIREEKEKRSVLWK